LVMYLSFRSCWSWWSSRPPSRYPLAPGQSHDLFELHGHLAAASTAAAAAATNARAGPV
jgi:hypothetical protein